MPFIFAVHFVILKHKACIFMMMTGDAACFNIIAVSGDRLNYPEFSRILRNFPVNISRPGKKPGFRRCYFRFLRTAFVLVMLSF